MPWLAVAFHNDTLVGSRQQKSMSNMPLDHYSFHTRVQMMMGLNQIQFFSLLVAADGFDCFDNCWLFHRH
jgi:hypothetical protein